MSLQRKAEWSWRGVFLTAAGGAAGLLLAFGAFGRLTLMVALAIAAASILGALAMVGLSHMRSRPD
jgi:uncharacterized membrane protein